MVRRPDGFGRLCLRYRLDAGLLFELNQSAAQLRFCVSDCLIQLGQVGFGHRPDSSHHDRLLLGLRLALQAVMVIKTKVIKIANFFMSFLFLLLSTGGNRVVKISVSTMKYDFIGVTTTTSKVSGT